MTSIDIDHEAVEKELKDRLGEGYILLNCGNSIIPRYSLEDRLSTIYAESIVAGLLRDDSGFAVSMRERRVTSEGAKYFVLSDGWLHGPFHEFFIKPGMLPELVAHLDKRPESVDARLSCDLKSKSFWKMRTKLDEARRKESELDLQPSDQLPQNHQKSQNTEKLKPVYDRLMVAKNTDTLEKEVLPTENYSESKASTMSPSFVAVLIGLFTLIILLIAMKYVGFKEGPQAASKIFDPLLLLVAVLIPLFVSLRFTLKKGISEAATRAKALVIGVLVFLALGALVSSLEGGGGEFCAYIVGCI